MTSADIGFKFAARGQDAVKKGVAMNKGGIVSMLLLISVVSGGHGWAEYGDVVMNSKFESMNKGGVKPVVFPHWFHRIRYKCKVCHEDIFVMQKGANNITMQSIMEEKFCGRCHNGIIAWEPIDCERCHSYTEERKAEIK